MASGSGGAASFRELIAGARRVCLDTNVIIYYLGRTEDPYPAMVEIALDTPDGKAPPHIAGLSYHELLVHPMRTGSDAARRIIEEFVLEATGEAPQPVSVAELEFAARLRAMTKLKAPDALIAASAALHGCDVIVGNDADFSGLEALYDMPIARRGQRPVMVPRFVKLMDYVSNVG